MPTQQKPEQNLSMRQEIAKKLRSRFVGNAVKDAEEGVASGQVSPQQALAHFGDEEFAKPLQTLAQLSQIQQPMQGTAGTPFFQTHKGLLPALVDLAKGNGFTFGQAKTQPIGLNTAVQLGNFMQTAELNDLQRQRLQLQIDQNNPQAITAKQREASKFRIFEKQITDANTRAANVTQASDALAQLKQNYYEGFQPLEVSKFRGGKVFDQGDLRSGNADQIAQAIAAKFKGLSEAVKGQLGTNPAARQYLNTVQAYATQIARGGLQDRGAFTDKDREVVTNMLNLALANREEADRAFGDIEAILVKPALRAGILSAKHLQVPIEDIQLPDNIKVTAQQAKEAFGDKYTDEVILTKILESIGRRTGTDIKATETLKRAEGSKNSK